MWGLLFMLGLGFGLFVCCLLVVVGFCWCLLDAVLLVIWLWVLAFCFDCFLAIGGCQMCCCWVFFGLVCWCGGCLIVFCSGCL